MSYKLQMDTERVITNILSKSLYSSADVFVREIIQNNTDAIVMRQSATTDDTPQGRIHLEIIPGELPTLINSDNGCGLTEKEIHMFLSTIGSSSKSDNEEAIGCFGIGMLSCFLISDEVTIITRSVKTPDDVLKWHCKKNGSYTVEKIDSDVEIGTKIFLRATEESKHLFDYEYLHKLIYKYGKLLPYPISLVEGRRNERVNDGKAPWEKNYVNIEAKKQAMMQEGQNEFGCHFLDCFEIKEAGVSGTAYVVAHEVSVNSKSDDRIYLKNMFLTQNSQDLRSPLAHPFKLILNFSEITPNASRETFQKDSKLRQARSALDNCFREYLVKTAKEQPLLMKKIMACHARSLKSLALEDNECFHLFIDLFTFETTLGQMTLGEYRQQNAAVKYTNSVDCFRQIAPVASSEKECIINAGYIYDADLLRKFHQEFPQEYTKCVDSEDFIHDLEDITLNERSDFAEFIRIADLVLQEHKCRAEIKKFSPHSLATMYSNDETGMAIRFVQKSKDIANGHWGEVLQQMEYNMAQATYTAQLCFNLNNPLVKKLATIKDPCVLETVVKVLYVQALQMGHHPLTNRELQLLDNGILTLVELIVSD
ncbi:HSP90 family protein [Candidatus Uabimicrobium amorphum]|uniref:Molecular chaperone HtpG n=1 Tax=Uabimicrobium amorphum TaxID=2596890 RepID=A0A5S9IQB4_UABAM|nr:HSP90 family protein [Candidatus Uabimicrobium amorphum]BBM86143.1 molecular chaperone HtpG [Candidatus Uabimicrobium amorphum]